MCWLVRVPDHLGDGVMAIPAIHALERNFSLLIEGPSWARVLYPNHNYIPARQKYPPQEGVILFKPSFGTAWRHRHHPIRIGIDINHRGFLLTKKIPLQSKHRIDVYLDIIRSLAPIKTSTPIFQPKPCDIPTLPTNSILCVIGTASAPTVRWKYFHSLQAYRDRLVFVGGPGNEPFLNSLSREGFKTLPSTLNLHQVGALAQNTSILIGLDGGLTHLAIAARNAISLSPKTSFVIYGSTDPEKTGPRNSTAIQKSTLPTCWPCYSKRCSIKTRCLDIPVSEITELFSLCQPS